MVSPGSGNTADQHLPSSSGVNMRETGETLVSRPASAATFRLSTPDQEPPAALSEVREAMIPQPETIAANFGLCILLASAFANLYYA